MCGVCLIDGDRGVWRSNKGSVYHRNRQDTDSSENSSSILQVLSHISSFDRLWSWYDTHIIHSNQSLTIS